MRKYDNIYDYVTVQENAFADPISVHGWEWSFKDHIQTTFFYKHGRLLNGNSEDVPVKNITKPLLTQQYRLEDIDVKEIVLYVDDPNDYFLSFLVKKYHDDVYVVENNIDDFIDKENEETVDYGVSIMEKTQNPAPEVRSVHKIAFCDQTDIANNPIAFKFEYNPAQLKEMEKKGWGNPANGATISIDDLIDFSTEYYQQDKNEGRENKGSGDAVEVYVVHGVLPKTFFDEKDTSGDYSRQFQIICYYKQHVDGKDIKRGATLFKKEVPESLIKVRVRDEIVDRCAGFGGGEELFETQVWTNYDEIRIKDMLDSASKTILKAIGANLKSRYPNGLKDMENLQIIDLNEGEDVGQIDTQPRSLQLFNQSADRWLQHAQFTASVQDPVLGKEAPSGTPFRAQERQVIEGRGIHEYRIGKHAKFLEEVYRDWIIPDIIKKITAGTTFLSTLSSKEMKFVADALVKNKVESWKVEQIFSGEAITEPVVQAYEAKVRDEFMNGGEKKFIKILKDEFKKKPLRVKISVSGKQKNLAQATDKLVNIFRQIISNPQGFQQAMQIPEMAESFNQILEYSGMTPVLYSQLTSGEKQAQAQPQQGQPQQGQLQESQPTQPELQASQLTQ